MKSACFWIDGPFQAVALNWVTEQEEATHAPPTWAAFEAWMRGLFQHRDEVLEIADSLYPKKYKQRVGETVSQYNQRLMQDLAAVKRCHPSRYPPEDRLCSLFVDGLLSHQMRHIIRYSGVNADSSRKLQTSFTAMQVQALQLYNDDKDAFAEGEKKFSKGPSSAPKEGHSSYSRKDKGKRKHPEGSSGDGPSAAPPPKPVCNFCAGFHKSDDCYSKDKPAEELQAIRRKNLERQRGSRGGRGGGRHGGRGGRGGSGGHGGRGRGGPPRSFNKTTDAPSQQGKA